jgi:hypothetical protein
MEVSYVFTGRLVLLVLLSTAGVVLMDAQTPTPVHYGSTVLGTLTGGCGSTR